MSSGNERCRRVAVIGQGYVGLPLAMRAVEVGFDVIGFDVDLRKIDSLSSGRTYIDDISDGDIASALTTGRYLPTSSSDDLAAFDVAVITVPTPLRDGAPDLSFIEKAARTVAPHIRAGSTVVLESTTFPGTTEEILAPLLEDGSGLKAGQDFYLGYSPERIDPGNSTWTFRTTPKVVSGIDNVSRKAVQHFYDTLVHTTVPVRGTREAEMCKLLENTFRHVNIALVNEMAIHANGLGIDIWNVLEAASTKPFGFMKFSPGPGVGGHCLPIDPSYLSWKVERTLGTQSRFVSTANDINSQMPTYIAHRLMLGLNKRGIAMNGAKILVLGLAYKKNSNDARESPAFALIDRLLSYGAEVSAHDPHVDDHLSDSTICRVALSGDVLSSADAVVLVTDHDCIDYASVIEHSSYVFDTRQRMAGDVVEHL